MEDHINLAHFNRQLLSMVEIYIMQYNPYQPNKNIHFKVSKETFDKLVMEYKSNLGGSTIVFGDEKEGLYVMAFGYRVYEDLLMQPGELKAVYHESMSRGI